ncbi:MAG: DUF3570 domain-containing protein, partial [Candidatus Eisenbacteria bacterium]|nr:DUF3570 domain-containing protein [Candidatus Eisenbacteria bacterium]
MQLKRFSPFFRPRSESSRRPLPPATKVGIQSSLAAASCALLGQGAAQGAEVDTAVLTYVEPGRVSAVEAVAQGSKELRNGHILGFKFVYDALTGASANGATPADRVQTFTRPSGQGSYSVDPGKTPLDTTFKDNRFALSGSWNFPVGRLSSATLGTNLSTETDYFSAGLSGSISRDLFLRNTTVSAGFSASADRINPQGGTPDPLTPMIAPTGGGHEGDFRRDDEGGGGPGGPAEHKNVVEGLVGVSQVLDRHTVMQLNYSASHFSGYQTDPYKILSVVAGASATTPGDPVDYLYEKRPDNRTKQSLYGEVRRRVGSDVADVSYRYFWDDWGIHSHTIDVHYDHQLGATYDIT